MSENAHQGIASIDVGDFAPKHYLHVDPDRVDYSVSDHELETLMNASSNSWKDFCIASAALGIPCAINAISDLKKVPLDITAGLFLNSLFGLVGIALGFAFGIMWKRTATTTATLIGSIKAKPKMRLGH